MRSRLEDVAARAGVSVATVSRVVNGKSGVSDQTRRRVQAEVEHLGYERPTGLVAPRSGLVGLIVPELETPIFPRLVQATESALASQGYTPVLCSATPAVQEDEYIDMLLERTVAGIVFICGRHANTEVDHTRYHDLRAEAMPMVFVNGWMGGLDAPFVSSDDVEAMHIAVEYCRDLGHVRIGCAMGPARYITTQRKTAGFLRAMGGAEHRGGKEQAAPDDLVINTVFSVHGGQAAMEGLLQRGVTAVVCGSDLMALGAIRAVRASGLTVPGDVSVIGYDDSMLIGFTDPPLTTMRQDVGALSRHAVGALLDDINGTPQPRRELLLHTQLVVRRSTALVRAIT